MAEDQVLSVLRTYPQIYHACHLEHPRARSNPGRISARDTWILGHLDQRHGTGPARLARHLALRPSTVSEAVRRLEGLGYITRRTLPADRRRIELYLTPQGAEAMRGASVLDAGRVARLLAEVPRGQRAAAVAGLARLAAAARALQATSR